jgi:SAM-dependent methyltransferase
MLWICLILILFWLLSSLQLGSRIRSLKLLEDTDTPASPDHIFLVAPGISLDPETRRAASAHAVSEGLTLLDLVPVNVHIASLMWLAALVDPRKYRSDTFTPGKTSMHAVLVHRRLLTLAGLEDTRPKDAADLHRLVAKLRPFASSETDIAIAPDLHAPPQAFLDRVSSMGSMLRHLLQFLLPVFFGFQLLLFALLTLGLIFTPWWGLAALAAFHLQPLLATLKSSLRPRGLFLHSLLRTPQELSTWLLLVLGGPREARERSAPLRSVYAKLLANGPDSFFEPRSESCPLCSAKDLEVHIRLPDLHQYKPGRFTLERCQSCGHLFQNPRLSPDGLDFYYRDFYDGLGEQEMEMIFSTDRGNYRDRALSLPEGSAPKNWLDVGAGHGHFCRAARDLWPDTKFDGLDLAKSIDQAAARRWVDRAYRGLFPDLAADLSGKYDVVSMSHYLEHTLSPKAEIEAARKVLKPGGYLLVELPNPESRFKSILRRYWMPYFQPQHLHLMTSANLERLLTDNGFTPQQWTRGETRPPVVWILATLVLLGQLGPQPHLPWRKESTFAGMRHLMVWTLGAPPLITAAILDQLSRLLTRRPKWSNAYRVLARLA